MDKKARSEAARKDALAAKRQLEQERALLVRNSLQNPNTTKKRKVFDSDGEMASDEESKQAKERAANVNFQQQTFTRDNRSGLKIQSSAFDERFQLDDRFIDDENDDSVASNVVGTDEQEAFKRPRRSKIEEPLPQKVNPAQFYEMDTDFLEILKKNASNTEDNGPSTSKGFVFLKAADIKSSTKATVEKQLNGHDIPLEELNRSRAEEIGSSDGEEDEAYGEDVNSANLLTKVDLKRMPFFFTGDEPEIRSVVSNFRRTQDEKKIENVWNTYRQSIQRIVNHMKRNARRNMKERGLKYNYGHKKPAQNKDV